MTTIDQLNKLIDDYGNLKRLQGKYDEMGVPAPHDLISQICDAWDLIVQHLVAAEVISEIIADNKLKAENLVLRNRVAEMRAALVIAEGFVQEVSQKTGFGQDYTLVEIRKALKD